MTPSPDIPPPFVTAPAPLRRAQRAAAEARLAYERARDSHQPSEALRRAWVLAKARLAMMEVTAW